ncbi:MAG: DUF2284 domain-containing protein [Lachnospiraceae bacterium]|nr:DUF2284 domain-containing protein [Robinsoniella sp.]MDY3767373.1 DUF2284 domain-containing protein [Lachnospiraceae bacterium]
MESLERSSPVRTGYQVQDFTAEVSVEEYLRDCVNVAEFLECCKACPNYQMVWSCPPYDFNPEDYWRQYRRLFLFGRKIIFSEEMTSKTYTPENLQELTDTILKFEKQDMSTALFAMERQYKGSVSLCAGYCQRCSRGHCTRSEGKPCLHSDQMRYSIESLGGNVGLTITRYLHQELLWMTEGKLPEYFILVSGLLKKE